LYRCVEVLAGKQYLAGQPWVWGFPWGFQWGFLWVWDGYGD